MKKIQAMLKSFRQSLNPITIIMGLIIGGILGLIVLKIPDWYYPDWPEPLTQQHYVDLINFCTNKGMHYQYTWIDYWALHKLPGYMEWLNKSHSQPFFDGLVCCNIPNTYYYKCFNKTEVYRLWGG